MKIVPNEFIEFLRSAPVDSGVCCCGGRNCTDHQFVDQWDWSLSRWLEQIDQPTNLHIKTQKAVKVIGEGRMQTKVWALETDDHKPVDMAPVMIYQEPNGDLWVRPKEEFDERFTSL